MCNQYLNPLSDLNPAAILISAVCVLFVFNSLFGVVLMLPLKDEFSFKIDWSFPFLFVMKVPEESESIGFLPLLSNIYLLLGTLSRSL